MAFKTAHYVCDWCSAEASFEDRDEGIEEGWIVVEARWLRDGEASYCCVDCFMSDIA
jgi:hypothetical protein